MEKSVIKAIGVIITIMVLLSSTQAEFNSIGRAFCKAKCIIKCAGEPTGLIQTRL